MASAYGCGFNKWFTLVIQDEAVANLWQRGIAGEALDSTDQLRFNSMAMMLFTSLENNFHQLQLGSTSRDTLELAKLHWERFMTSPGGSVWWKRQGRESFTPEFVEAIEAMIAVADPDDLDD